MKKIMSLALVLVGYCILLSFLGMYEDAVFNSMWLYALTIIGYGFLCWLSIRYRSLLICFWGMICPAVCPLSVLNYFKLRNGHGISNLLTL